MKTVGFQAGEILLPRCDLEKWSVVACDQFTSQPEYWEEVERIVGDAPSAYRLIFPEALLSKVNFEEKIDSINQKMEKYWNEGLFQSYPDAMIYVERTLLDGSVRKGILGLLDLEEYDYRKGSGSLVRATEGTVMERIPPRVQIREHALLELPHVLVLVDDPEKTVVEPVAERRKTLQGLYDFRLMQGGGRIRGWLLDEVERERVTAALEKLGDPEKFREKYGVDAPVLLYAVGDGNHSLASAKECWNRIKAGLSPEEATGRGAGLSDAGLEKKKRAVSMAVGRFYETYPQYRGGTKEDYENGALSAVTVLSELGGFDLAGMTGLFLGGAAAGLPVLMDGFLSTVSALLAVLIRREAKDYLFASHISREPAGKSVLEMLGLPAPLHLGMHLGEGSGAVAMIPLLKMGASVYEEMSTFSDISVEQYVDYEKEVRT